MLLSAERFGATARNDRRTLAQIIFNPQAGGFSRRRLRSLERRLNAAGFDIHHSACGPTQGVSLCAEADELIVMGGDGTLRHVLQASVAEGRERRIMLCPGGTVNLLARDIAAHGPPKEPLRTLGCSHHPCFVAEINGALMVNCASVSPDAYAVAACSARLKRWIGRLAYMVAFVKVVGRWERPAITLHWATSELACEAFYVAKSRFYAGPWSVAGNARAGEPLLHVVALRQCTRMDYLRFIASTVFGRPREHDANIVRFTCDRLEADADQVLPIQVDGDIAATAPARIAMRSEPMGVALV